MKDDVNLFLEQKHRELVKYARGADVALLNTGDHYVAHCAHAVLCRRAAGTLGTWKEGPQEMHFGHVSMPHVLSVLRKYRTVALMERTVDKAKHWIPPYVLIWTVERVGTEAPPETLLETPAEPEGFDSLLD